MVLQVNAENFGDVSADKAESWADVFANDLANLPRPLIIHISEYQYCDVLAAFYSAQTPGARVLFTSNPEIAPNVVQFYCSDALDSQLRCEIYRYADVVVAANADDAVNALLCGAAVAALPTGDVLATLGRDGRGPQNDFPMTVGAVEADLSVAIAKATRCDKLGAAVAGYRLVHARSATPIEISNN